MTEKMVVFCATVVKCACVIAAASILCGCSESPRDSRHRGAGQARVWAMGGADASRTFRGEHWALREEPVIIWELDLAKQEDLKGVSIVEAVCDQNTVYILGRKGAIDRPDHTGSLFALRLKDGKLMWRRDEAWLDSGEFLVGLSKNRVIVVCEDRTAAFDAQTGKTLWQARRGRRSSRPSTLVLVEDRAYVSYKGSKGSEIVALDCGNGSMAWRTSVKLQGHLLLAAAKDTLVVACDDDYRIAAFQLSDGKPRWTVEFPPLVKDDKNEFAASGFPAIVGDQCLVAGWQGITGGFEQHLAAFDLNTGKLIWNRQGTGGFVMGFASNGTRVWVRFSKDDDRSERGGIICLDVSDGTVIWRLMNIGWIMWAPVVTGDNLLAVTSEGTLYGLDGKEGKMLWKRPPKKKGRPVGAGVMVSGGCIVQVADSRVTVSVVPTENPIRDKK